MLDHQNNYPYDYQHNLTEEEMDHIAELVCKKIEKSLYTNIGSGVVGFMWKGIVMGIIAIAAYGYFDHFGK